jgi:Uncharacterized protein conserved in bacteria (DUF2125)
MRAKTFHQEGHVMTRPVLSFSGGIAALLLSTAAWADVTPEQVWQNWQDVSSSYGQTLAATSQERQGETLVISGMSISSTFEGGAVNGRIDTVNFRDLGDGRVEVTMSPEYPLTVDSTTPEGAKSRVTVTVRQPDLVIIASGDATETRYDFSGPSVKVTLNEVTTDGTPVDMALEVDVTTIAGNYTVTAGDTPQLTSSLTADNAAMTLALNDAETSATFNMKGNFTTLAGTSAGSLLDMAAMADMGAALKAGFTSDTSFTYGAGELEFDFAEGEQTGSGTVGSGNIAFAMNADRLNYGGGAKDVTLTVSSSDMPVPQLTTSYAEAAFNLLMPVSKAETPGEFALVTRLVDFTINDEAWALVDPGTVLPRDPATVIVDVAGTMKWLVDIMTPAETEAMAPDQMPAEVNTLNVSDLTVRAAGAEVTGKGAFTFDNTDTTTFPGIPAPTGTLDLRIVGANTLIDKLIQLGFLPEDQAMGARMMMGLFAKPVEGEPDTLTSTLEFKDKGFYANGQRLQ